MSNKIKINIDSSINCFAFEDIDLNQGKLKVSYIELSENLILLDKSYYKTKENFEKKTQKFYEKAKVNVNTYAFNKRSDLENYETPENLEPVLANGGSENFKEELIPNSFNEIEAQINKDL
tara:strand:+ start:186 stop:548 length:363 start_codon:yes stop_codon:yes gene_type:complete